MGVFPVPVFGYALGGALVKFASSLLGVHTVKTCTFTQDTNRAKLWENRARRIQCPERLALNSTFGVRMRDSGNPPPNSREQQRSFKPSGTGSRTTAGLQLNVPRLEACEPPPEE